MLKDAQQHYRYDALGRRIVAMEISGAADDSNTLITLGRRYIYDGWSVVEERTFDNGATLGDSPNTLERVYVNGRSIDEPLLAAIDGDGDELLNTNKNTTNGVNIVDAEYYYLSNRLGSISAILDADNQDRILEYYRYEVFGSATVLPIVDNNADGIEDTPLNLNDNNNAGPALVSSFGNTYLYTARRFDDITGLYYYRNRYYDPRSGRFIHRDGNGYGNTLNLYHYTMNRPSFFTDPSGNITVAVSGWEQSILPWAPNWGDNGYMDDWGVGGAISGAGATTQTTFAAWTQVNDCDDPLVQTIINDIQANPDEPVILIGHSYGGDSIFHLAECLCCAGIYVDAFITIDAVGVGDEGGRYCCHCIDKPESEKHDTLLSGCIKKRINYYATEAFPIDGRDEFDNTENIDIEDGHSDIVGYLLKKKNNDKDPSKSILEDRLDDWKGQKSANASGSAQAPCWCECVGETAQWKASDDRDWDD